MWEIWVQSLGWEDPLERKWQPLQYSCLENPMDGGTWWSTDNGVAKSQTGLSNFPFTAQKTFYSLKSPIEAPLVNSFIWIVKLVFWLYRVVFWLFLWGFLINRSASIFNSIQHTCRKSTTQDHVSCKPKFKAQSKDNTERVSVQFLIVHVTEFYFHYIDTNHRRWSWIKSLLLSIWEENGFYLKATQDPGGDWGKDKGEGRKNWEN